MILKVIVKLLDPIAFLVIILLNLITREKWIIPVSAIIVAVLYEFLLGMIGSKSHTFGTSLLPGIIASTIHALIAYKIVGWYKSRKTKSQE